MHITDNSVTLLLGTFIENCLIEMTTYLVEESLLYVITYRSFQSNKQKQNLTRVDPTIDRLEMVSCTANNKSKK